MRNYIAVVHKDEDSCYGVHFPDVPGCASAGDTLDEALANAAEALRFFAEDVRNMSAPRSLEDIRKDVEVEQDISEGAVFAAAPLLAGASRA